MPNIKTYKYTSTREASRSEIDEVTCVPRWVTSTTECHFCCFDFEKEDKFVIVALVGCRPYFFHQKCYQQAIKEND